MTKKLVSRRLPYWEKGKPIPKSYTSVNETKVIEPYAPLDLEQLLKWLKNENK